MTGILPVDKPEGKTSHDVVAGARRALGIRRIGHTGTLDPFATGLLLLCLGPATRLAEYLGGLDKTYEATARLGVQTDSLDLTGAITATSDAWRTLDAEAIRQAFEGQVGTLRQRPPAYSAKKIHGRRAYELARAGRPVEPAPVEVHVRSLHVTDVDGPDVRFAVTCSTGTYVRALARDAGDRLGVGAHLTLLRRVAIGRFNTDFALAIHQLEDADAVRRAIVSPLRALDHLPVVALDSGEADAIRHGRSVPVAGRAPAGTVALSLGEALVAVAECDGDTLKPRKVLA